MKRCPICSRVYADEGMRFCLDDGSQLVETDTAFSSPETVRIPEPKGTGSMRTEVLPSSASTAQASQTPGTPALTRRHIKILVLVGAFFIVSLIATKLWVNAYGDDELLYQAANGNPTRMKLLLFFGADVDARDETRGTALMGAAYRGSANVVKILLDHRANVYLKNRDNETALILAAKKGNTDVIKMLLEMSPDVNARDGKGWTALMWAAWVGNEETARLLLKAGADVTIKNDLGETALDLARKRNSGVKWLLMRP